jgi:hypothetical protein
MLMLNSEQAGRRFLVATSFLFCCTQVIKEALQQATSHHGEQG